MIYWDALTWEAFATMFAGILAVIAAMIVGLRQAAILKDQVDISKHQIEIQWSLADIESLKVKSELFNARFEVYDAVRKWLGHIVGEARAPQANGSDPEERAILDNFIASWDRSRFLFRPAVYQRLDELRKLSHRLTYHQRMMKAPIDTEERMAEHQKHIDGEYRSLMEFSSVIEDLSVIFGDELNLSIHGAVHGQLPKDEQQE